MVFFVAVSNVSIAYRGGGWDGQQGAGMGWEEKPCLVRLGDFRDCENNCDVVYIIVMLMSTFHNRDYVI